MPLLPTIITTGSLWRTSVSTSISEKPAAPSPSITTICESGRTDARGDRVAQSRCRGSRTGRCRASRRAGGPRRTCRRTTRSRRRRRSTTASRASQLAELAVDPGRLDRIVVGGQQRQLGIGLTAFSASRSSAIHSVWSTPIAGVVRRARAGSAAMSPATVGTSTCAAVRDAASTTWATCAAPNRPNPTRKSSGVPITTTTSARSLSAPRVRRNASGWSAGSSPRPRPLKKHGTPSSSAAASSSHHAPSQ